MCDGGGAAAVGVGAGGSSMRASKLTGVLVPRIELELPVGDRVGLDIMCSCNTCVIIGGRGSTIRPQGPTISHHKGVPSFSWHF